MILLSLYDWIYSKYPSDLAYNGQWKPLHIIILLLAISSIVGISFLRKKDKRIKNWLIVGIGIALVVLEFSRRIINFSNPYFEFSSVIRDLLPRPWCAISVWSLLLCTIIDKKFFYNFTAMSGIINCIIYFAYPVAGFENKAILFESVYSIGTHTLLIIGSVSLITLGFTDFRYKRETLTKGALKELIAIIILYTYALIEIYILKIEADPLFFMPGNDVEDILGIPHTLYLVIYFAFLTLYFNSFYLIPMLKNYIKNKKQNKTPLKVS